MQEVNCIPHDNRKIYELFWIFMSSLKLMSFVEKNGRIYTKMYEFNGKKTLNIKTFKILKMKIFSTF